MSRKLSDITEFIIDTKHNTPEYVDEGYPCIRTPNIGRGYFDLDNIKYVSEATYEKWTERAVPKEGDLILAREAPVGNVAWIPPGLKVCIGQRTVLIRPLKDIIDPRYLNYYLLSDECQNRMHSLSGGATVAHLNMSDIRAFEVHELPTLTAQKQIATILSAYDDLIENNLRRIKILEEMAKNLYREWFVNFRFPGHENTHFVDSPLGKIPEGWRVENLFSIADVTYGYAFKSSLFNTDGLGKPVVRIRDVLSGVSKTFSTEEPNKKYLVENGDILIGMDGDFHMGFWVGGQAYLVQRVARFRAKRDIGNYLLFLSLINPIKRFNSTITGTTVAHLGDKHLKTINILLPDKEFLSYCNRILESYLGLIISLKLKNQVLQKTRDLLLPKLISGEVDVSELDIKVPEEAVS